MVWKTPHINKVYEALSAIADGRITLDSTKLVARVYSTSGNKYYTVEYNPEQKAIMSNDNSAYYTDTLSYPMIAFLMIMNEIPYDNSLLAQLKGIKWKDLNQKYKNDFDLSTAEVLSKLESDGADLKWLKSQVEIIYSRVKELKLDQLGKKKLPSKLY